MSACVYLLLNVCVCARPLEQISTLREELCVQTRHKQYDNIREEKRKNATCPTNWNFYDEYDFVLNVLIILLRVTPV